MSYVAPIKDMLFDEYGMLTPPDIRIERYVCACVFMPPRVVTSAFVERSADTT